MKNDIKTTMPTGIVDMWNTKNGITHMGKMPANIINPSFDCDYVECEQHTLSHLNSMVNVKRAIYIKVDGVWNKEVRNRTYPVKLI
ncbi:MAG: hypothetical protein PHT44_04695 [Candidatus Portnoybacteria bacterium]|nr:hypothetical protein [Candidatus Portnoybacteria bacterium]